MSSWQIKTCLLLQSVLFGSSIHAQEPPPLTHNPFTRPPSATTIEARPQLLPDGSIQQIDLRATMASPGDSLANVAGRILRPGDDFEDYTLLQVFEDRAIFTREGKRLTVYVKPIVAENDE